MSDADNAWLASVIDSPVQLPTFEGFPKVARLSRPCIVTEKIDGTNAQILITDDGQFLTGSRNRWITSEADNFGFARWAREHEEELRQLGSGRHFGEWWGRGIGRGYGLSERHFSLFNVARWRDDADTDAVLPACVSLVPVLYEGVFSSEAVELALFQLAVRGSRAVSGFMRPEGVVVYHSASRTMFKKTIEADESPKSVVQE